MLARTVVSSAVEAKDDEAAPHVASHIDRAVESLDTVGTVGPESALPNPLIDDDAVDERDG